MDAVAGAEGLPFVGFAIVVGVFELPEIGNAGEENLAIADEDAGRDSIRDAIETAGENGRRLGFAIAVLVLDETEDFGFLSELYDIRAEFLREHLSAIGNAAERKVVIEPIEVAADIENTFVIAESGADGGMAVRFYDVKISLGIYGEGDWILQERFDGEEFGLKAGWEAKLIHHFDGITDGLRSGRTELGSLKDGDEREGEDGEHGVDVKGLRQGRKRQVTGGGLTWGKVVLGEVGRRGLTQGPQRGEEEEMGGAEA